MKNTAPIDSSNQTKLPDTNRPATPDKSATAWLIGALPMSLLINPFAAVALIIVVLFVSPVIRQAREIPMLGVIGFLLLAAASTASQVLQPWSDDPAIPTSALQQLVYWTVAAVILWQFFKRISRQYIHSASVGFSISAIVALLVAVYQLLVQGQSQVTLFAHHPNIAAAQLLVLAGGSIVAADSITTSEPRMRLIMFGGISAAVLTLLLTGSRSGLVGLSTGVVWWLSTIIWQQYKLRIRRHYLTLMILASITAVIAALMTLSQNYRTDLMNIPTIESTLSREVSAINRSAESALVTNPEATSFIESLSRRFRIFFADPTSASGDRIAMWLLGLELVQARPVLGFGPGSEPVVATVFAENSLARPLPHFHSIYIKLLLEGGIIMCALVMTVLVKVIISLSRWTGHKAGHSTRSAVAAMWVALSVQSAFDPALAFAVVLGGAIIVTVVINSSHHTEQQQNRQFKKL